MRWIPHEYSKFLPRHGMTQTAQQTWVFSLDFLQSGKVRIRTPYYRVYYTTLVPFQTNWGMYSSWLHLSSKDFQQKILVIWVMIARWKKKKHPSTVIRKLNERSSCLTWMSVTESYFHELFMKNGLCLFMFKQVKKKAIFSGWDSFLKQVFQGNILLNKKGIRQDTKIWKPSKHFCQSKPTTLIKQPANMCQPTLSCENSWAFPKSARILHTSCLAQSLDSSAHQMSWPLTQSTSSSLISYTSLP